MVDIILLYYSFNNKDRDIAVQVYNPQTVLQNYMICNRFTIQEFLYNSDLRHGLQFDCKFHLTELRES